MSDELKKELTPAESYSQTVQREATLVDQLISDVLKAHPLVALNIKLEFVASKQAVEEYNKLKSEETKEEIIDEKIKADTVPEV